MTGEGARLYGGRWNPKGVAVVYLADSLALDIATLLADCRSSPYPKSSTTHSPSR